VGSGNSTQGSAFRVRDEALTRYFSHITNIKTFGFNLQKVICDVGKVHKGNIQVMHIYTEIDIKFGKIDPNIGL
jgi:hypothetical protein